MGFWNLWFYRLVSNMRGCTTRFRSRLCYCEFYNLVLYNLGFYNLGLYN